MFIINRFRSIIITLLMGSLCYSMDHLNQQLISASGAGDAHAVRMFIDAGAQVDAMNGDHNTPLLLATCSNSTATAQLLIRAGADVNRVGAYCMTPLSNAIGNKNDVLIKDLLEAGSNPNTPDMHGNKPLNSALGNPPLIKTLRRFGAIVDLNEQRHGYYIPALPLAINLGHFQSAFALIEPVISLEARQNARALLMAHRRPESPASMLPKDVIKLIISISYPEYTLNAGMDPLILAQQDPDVIADRVPLNVVARLTKSGYLDQQVVLDSWNRKLATVSGTVIAAGSVDPLSMQNFNRFALEQVTERLK